MTRKQNDHLYDAYKSVAKSGIVVFFVILFTRFMGYLIRFLLARLLGKTDYGLISLAVSILEVIALLATIGLPIAMQRFIGFYLGRQEPAGVRSTIYSVFKISVPLSLGIAGGLFLLAEPLANYVFREPALTPILRIFACALPLLNWRQLLEAVFQGFKKTFYYVVTNASFFTLVPTLFLLFYFGGYQLRGAVFGYFLAYLISFILAVGGFLKINREFPLRGPHRSTVTEIFRFSWPLTLNSMLWFLMIRIDTLMVGSFKGADAVGLYNAALPLAQFNDLFLQSFGFLFLPVISELFSRGDLAGLQKIYQSTIKWIAILTFPICIVLFGFAQFALTLLFGSEYGEAYRALQIVSIGYFLQAALGLQTWVLNATGKTLLLFLNSLAGFVLNAVLNWVLIPPYGISGAAAATAVSLSVYNLSGIAILRVTFNIKSFSWKPIRAIFLGTILFLLVRIFLPLKSITFAGFLLSVTLFCVLYFPTHLFTKVISEDDKPILEMIEGKVGRRFTVLRRILGW